jgi:hypothetical protein
MIEFCVDCGRTSCPGHDLSEGALLVIANHQQGRHFGCHPDACAQSMWGPVYRALR